MSMIGGYDLANDEQEKPMKADSNTIQPDETIKTRCAECGCPAIDGRTSYTHEVTELKAEIERLKAALRRIDIKYRESSGLPVHIQAYCMRSEAKVALDPQMQSGWDEQLRDFQSRYPRQALSEK